MSKLIICSCCSREYKYDRKSGHTKVTCNSCNANKHKNTIQKRCVDLLGGKCVICGYKKCIRALDFHHVCEKSFIISGSHTKRWSTLVEELKKCLLVCCRCHREIHSDFLSEDTIYELLYDSILLIEKSELSKLPDYSELLEKDHGYCLVCEKYLTSCKVKYCSIECYKSTVETKKPSKEELQKDLFCISIGVETWVSLGEKYKVSDNAVRKWARSYGLM